MLHWLPKPWWSSKRPNTVAYAQPPTSVSGLAIGGGGGGGNWKIARSSSNDKERAAQPRSDVCIIVVVTKCSWLIIPPSFANRAAANLHINGASEGYDVKECGLSVWLRLGSRGHQPYNKQDSPHPRVPYHLPSLQNPQHEHHTPCCVSLINRRNRMEDRLLFGRGGGGGLTDIAKSSLPNQRVAPGLVQL